MTNKKTHFGPTLKSLATQLTRWMRPRKKVTEVEEVPNGTEVVAKIKPITTIKPKQKVIRSRPAPKPKEEPIIVPESFVSQDKPDLPAVATAEEGPQTQPDHRSPVSDILTSFPENTNLVGQTEVMFTLDDKKHSLMIRTDSMYLDAQKYIVTANGGALGGDVELDILECSRTGNTLILKVGAFGKDVTLTLDASDAKHMFELLLKGKTSKHAAERGQMIEITRNNY